jgi:hypothetical protein
MWSGSVIHCEVPGPFTLRRFQFKARYWNKDFSLDIRSMADMPYICASPIRTRGKLGLVGRAIAEAVSCWLPTAAARVRACVWSSGICGGQTGIGVGFLRVIRFPLPKPFILSNSILTITRGKYNRPVVAAVPSGPSMDSAPQYSNKKTRPSGKRIFTTKYWKFVWNFV